MLHRIIYLLLPLLAVGSYGQSVTRLDNWYKVTMNNYYGYLHYTVTEEPEVYITALEFRLKISAEIISYTAEIKSHKDKYLTPVSFRVKGKEKEADFLFDGTVTKKGNSLFWQIDRFDKTIATQFPTLTDWNLFYLLTTFSYKEKGDLLHFNSMEISELHYKENHVLRYEKDDIIMPDKQEIKTRKVVHSGDGIGESSFWIDDKNRLVMFSIDNYKNYILVNKESISLKDFEENQ